MAFWYPEEIADIVCNYERAGSAGCKLARKKHNSKSIQHKARKLGMASKLWAGWEPSEIEDIVANYPTRGYAGCDIALARHSPMAIRLVASRRGISMTQKHPALRVWSQKEDDEIALKQLTGIRINLHDYRACAAAGRSVKAIQKRVHTLRERGRLPASRRADEWTEKEDEEIRKHFSECPIKESMRLKALKCKHCRSADGGKPRRTIAAIMMRSYRRCLPRSPRGRAQSSATQPRA